MATTAISTSAEAASAAALLLVKNLVVVFAESGFPKAGFVTLFERSIAQARTAMDPAIGEAAAQIIEELRGELFSTPDGSRRHS